MFFEHVSAKWYKSPRISELLDGCGCLKRSAREVEMSAVDNGRVNGLSMARGWLRGLGLLLVSVFV